MITHYFKIAFRNMRKYKNQTLISVVGLAVGFTCFALATLWIRYEMSFDNFHKNAKQMYVVYRPSVFQSNGYERNTAYRLPFYLKETFPEIVNATPLRPSYSRNVTMEGVDFPAVTIVADSSFFRIFDVKILEGSRDFSIPSSKKVAITQRKALQLFGDEHPIGKTVNINGSEFTICAIVSDMSKRSNYAFDLIQPFSERTASNHNLDDYIAHTIIELNPKTDIKEFEKKLYEHHIIIDADRSINKMVMKPISKLRYTDPDIIREVKFQHIVIFAVSGILVILCSLFNYLTLFVSRFRIRQKELALRVMCGASGGSLLAMLSIEFIFTLLIAVFLGWAVTQLVHEHFLTLSEIQMGLPAIYRESLMYIGGIILVSLLAFWLILFIFRRRNLNASIRRSNQNMSRKISVVVQLVISTGFAFCAIVILKQMYFLHHTADLGFSFQNRGSITIHHEGVDGVLANHLKQIPEITEIVEEAAFMNLVPPGMRTSAKVSKWDDQPVDAGELDFEQMIVTPEYCAFFDFRLLVGEMLTDADPDSLVLLNESAVKAFGWHDPVGKIFNGKFRVKGVIKNVYNLAPTITAHPFYYVKGSIKELFRSNRINIQGNTTVLFKYHDGMWKYCKEKIEQMIKNELVDLEVGMDICNFEEEYGKYLKSEKALMKLLSFVSAICVLICVFGFVSLVSLTCEEQRKEIAIRKINGATAGDILTMFAKEYFLLLFIGAVIAFTTGYFIMQRWLEQYVKQTSIPAWIYLGIVFVLALVIVLCVGWQVWRASGENPAEVVKSE